MIGDAGFKCSQCNENHPACLDFHHLDPTNKVDSVSNMVRTPKSVVAIKAEIEKCICLCANCHRKVHAEELL